MTRLNVWCLSGLGNRMRALLGAKELADRNGWSYSYTWDRYTAGMTAQFSELWDNNFQRTSPVWALAHNIPNGKTFLPADMREWAEGTESNSRIPIRTGEKIVDRSGEALDWGKQLRMLRPSGAVVARLNPMWAQLRGKEYVGVMVRAHGASHEKSLELSPVDWYERRMTELVQARPGIRFYVSSDVPAVADRLAAQFPGSIAQGDKGKYNTTKGTQAAVADLYMLAASMGVLRPFWSSFTTMSSELAAKKIVLEDSQSEVGLTLDNLVPPALDVFEPWRRSTVTP